MLAPVRAWRRGGAAGHGGLAPRGLRGVDRAVVDQALPGNRDHREAVVLDAEEAVIGHVPDRRGVELPLGADRLDVGDAARLGHDEHPLL